MEDAFESLLLTLLRDGARGMVSPPGRSPVRPARLPISVVVRSIDMTPGADERRSCFPVPPECLGGALDLADKLDVLLVRPLAFGSRSASIMGEPTALPGDCLGIGKDFNRLKTLFENSFERQEGLRRCVWYGG